MNDFGDIHITIIEYSSDSNNSIVFESQNIDNENQILSPRLKKILLRSIYLFLIVTYF